VQVTRVTDTKVLDVPVDPVPEIRAPGGVQGEGTAFAVNNNSEPALATLRYKLRDAAMDAAEEPFESAGKQFNRGSFLVGNVSRADLDRAATDLGVQVTALSSVPSVKTHPIRAARLGWDGVSRLQEFVQKGGVLLTATDTSTLALSLGFADGISTQNANKMKIVGSVLGTRLVDVASPIAYGYDEKGAAYCDNGPIFSLSSIAGQRGRRRLGPEMHARPTGRGSSDDPDFTVGRVGVEAPEEPKSEIWESPPVLDEQKRNGFRVIPSALRPRVIFRYADNKDLLISGLAEGVEEIAQHPAVVDAPSGKGHVVLFSINPVYRGETWGTYSMVLNTILNFDSLNAGRKDAAQ